MSLSISKSEDVPELSGAENFELNPSSHYKPGTESDKEDIVIDGKCILNP